MGFYDRDYTQDHFKHRFGNAPQMRMKFPQMTPAVKKLLIANIAVFFIGIVFFPANILIPSLGFKISLLERWFAVFPYSSSSVLQVWRLLTYQFLHGGIWHILFNMVGLFFLGPTLERHWGTKRFVFFYLGCGAAGGVFYTLLALSGYLQTAPMIGASGAILGMLAACAILFPHFVVFFFLFPVPIRVAAIILTLAYMANILMIGGNAGGDAAHLAGMAAGAIYVFSEGWRQKLNFKLKSSIYEKKTSEQRKLQFELDRILKKVHDNGIQSLTWQEKKILKKATQQHQKTDFK